MIGGLPGLNFKLFGFPVTIGVDFAILALLFSVRARPEPIYLVEWLVVLTVSILVHELGHGFAYRRYSIHPHIRLWGLGGLTISGFPLPPRKSIVVSVAGPGIGIVVGAFVLAVSRWLPDQPLLNQTAFDIVWVNLGWAILNLLPIAGLDGGNIVESLFLLVRGERGRRPGLLLVGIASIVIAVAAAFGGFIYLSLIVLVFGLVNPAPYLELWHTVQGARPARFEGRPAVRPADRWQRDDRPAEPVPVPDDEFVPRRRGGKLVIGVGPETRRRFGEVYSETLHEEIDLEELDSRPEPLLADVAEMLHRGDDEAVAARLVGEEDELSVLAIVARTVEAGRVRKVIAAIASEARAVAGTTSAGGGAASGAGGDRSGRGSAATAAVKVQISLHALGRYEESMSAGKLAANLAPATAESRLLFARSAARHGDRRQTRDALDDAIRLGLTQLSDGALGDLARLGPDRDVAAALARLRGAPHD